MLGVTVHDQVWIVCNQYDLAASFRCLEICRKEVVDGFIIEVLVRLIHNQGTCVANIHSEIKNQKHNSFRSGG